MYEWTGWTRDDGLDGLYRRKEDGSMDKGRAEKNKKGRGTSRMESSRRDENKKTGRKNKRQKGRSPSLSGQDNTRARNSISSRALSVAGSCLANQRSFRDVVGYVMLCYVMLCTGALAQVTITSKYKVAPSSLVHPIPSVPGSHPISLPFFPSPQNNDDN